LPAATTAVSPDRSPQPMPVVAIAQPIAVRNAPLPLGSPRLSEAALLLLVGTGLLGLGAIVRRTT
jgi:hypothetical protein